jgi:hypothetical protein
MTPVRRAAPRSVAEVVAVARIAFARERSLFGLGMSGLMIALLCLVAAGVRGSFIPPEGKLLDAAAFAFGVGLFILTIGLLLPVAGYTQPARRRWRRLSYIFWGFSFVLEPLQAFRGIDPRFAEAGDITDAALGIIWAVTAGLVVFLVVVLGLRFFRADVLQDRPLLRVGIRYGILAVWLSFGVGVVMTFNGGRVVGEAGNLMLSHALGVHGIQALPAVALLLVWAAAASRARLWLHAAGIGWLAVCTATLVQAQLGRAPLEPSLLTVLVAAGLAVWVATAVYAFLGWRRCATEAQATVVQ